MDDRLRIYVGVIADVLEARVVACWSVNGRTKALRAQVGLDQDVLDAVDAAWARRRDALLGGQTIPLASGSLRPIREGGRLQGLLYVDSFRTAPAVGEAEGRIGRWLALSAEPEPVDVDTRHPQHRQLELLLSATSGNVAAAARRAGVSRQTIYSWCDRFGVDPNSFRP